MPDKPQCDIIHKQMMEITTRIVALEVGMESNSRLDQTTQSHLNEQLSTIVKELRARRLEAKEERKEFRIELNQMIEPINAQLIILHSRWWQVVAGGLVILLGIVGVLLKPLIIG